MQSGCSFICSFVYTTIFSLYRRGGLLIL